MTRKNLNMSAAEIRRAFIDYFVAKEHTEVESASLIPAGDPSLLFTNSGMVPFKDVFLGKEKRSYNRAVTAQRCVRAGGKHNDLENVGYTARHHTFFEMLGNFSFGDYFKQQAIVFAWELVTEKIGLPPDSLWVTVHHTDKEAHQIWHKEIGVPLERIASLDEDNFWQMGETGPCGPCSEIFYDHGPEIAGGPPGSPNEDEGERFIEIWNLVFMQFNRNQDGALNPLPRPSVDTGMGLERMAAVLQGVHNNYETDLFGGLIKATKGLCNERPLASSLHIIADHIRSSAFLIADGVQPSNEGRGYVLRRIMRRAIRHGHKLGIESPFFHKLVEPLATEMGDAYPIIRQARIAQTIKKEEERFAQTLQQGLELLNREIAQTSGKQLAGELVFTLYDTYGFPPDLSADIAQEKGMAVDWDEFGERMEQQRKRSRAYSMFRKQQYSLPRALTSTEFVGYEQNTTNTEILALLNAKGEGCTKLEQGEEGIVILARTPFYAESGGQTGDRGNIICSDGLFEVRDTQKQDELFLHFGQTQEGSLKTGSQVEAQIDLANRLETSRHHSATHLLHSALHQIIGKEAQQRGSRVTANHLRLDFTYGEAMTSEQLNEVEDWVNDRIQAAEPVSISHKPLNQAKKEGALALFGEKYGEQVRVVKMGEASIELCGGTHVKNLAAIGSFILLSESSISAGVRRIEALTSLAARKMQHNQRQTLAKLTNLLQTKDNNQMIAKVESLNSKVMELERKLSQLDKEQKLKQLTSHIKKPLTINGIQLLALPLENMPVAAMNEFADRCRDEIESGILVLANKQRDKVSLLISSSGDIAKKYPAKELAQYLAKQLDGSGGGDDKRARGGGSKPLSQTELKSLLGSAENWIASH